MASPILKVVSPDELAQNEAREAEAAAAATENDQDQDLSQLVGFIRKEFRNAKDARYKSGMSSRMIEALRTYKAEYSPE